MTKPLFPRKSCATGTLLLLVLLLLAGIFDNYCGGFGLSGFRCSDPFGGLGGQLVIALVGCMACLVVVDRLRGESLRGLELAERKHDAPSVKLNRMAEVVIRVGHEFKFNARQGQDLQ